MQSTWERVKNKESTVQLGAQNTVQLRDEGSMEASIFHSFLSSLVTQYKTFTLILYCKQTIVVVEGRGKNCK